MRSRAVRATLMLLAVGAMSAAAYLCWQVQSDLGAATRSAAVFEQTRNAALRDAYELRSAQQAYVATGQNETFWFGKSTEASESLRATLTSLKSTTPSPAATLSLDEALAAVEDFEQIDKRARSYTSAGQKLLAADVIFSDGLEAAGRILAALEQAGAATAQWNGALAATATRDQAKAAGGAAVIALLALLLLMPRAVAPTVAVAETPMEPMRVPDTNEGLDLGSLLDDATPGRLAATAVVETPVTTAGPAQPDLALQELAGVCTELARLSDTSLLPGILERTAAALDASGLVLWAADPDGVELVPIAAHGYPASVLSRMGSLKTDAENATSAAYRTGLIQTVSADAVSNGAIAVPLVAPGGSRGVMSAEVRHDAEKQPARLAAASIIAAQLATLIGPPAARAEDRTTAAL